MPEWKDPAREYCEKVLAGEIVACKKIKLMCKRQMNDLDRQGDEDFPYYWDEDIAQKGDLFIQSLPDVDKGVPIPLALYQRALFLMLMAWQRNDGGKRWRRAVYSVARTNAKTQLASWISTWEFLYGTPKHNRQILCCAISNDVAERLLRYCQSELNYIAKFNEDLERALSIRDNDVQIKSANTFMKKISKDTHGIDNYHATTAVLDEYHLIRKDDFTDKITSGMVGNDKSFFFIISTAGKDIKVPMYQQYQGLWHNIITGKVLMDDYFVAIYEADSDDEVYHPELWEKANPIMAVSDKRETMLKTLPSERDVAIQEDKLSAFINKNMNRWKSLSDTSLIPSVDDWEKCTKKDFDIDGRDVYIGMDLGKSSDNSTNIFNFPYMENGEKRWHIVQHSFIGLGGALGIEGKEKKDGIYYRRLEKKGECTITKLASGYVDYDLVYEWLCNFIDDHHLNVITVNYDKYGFASIISKIEKQQDWEIVPVGQTFQALKEPTDQFQMLFGDGQITHDDDEMLKGAFTNAVVVENDYGKKIDKYNDKAGFRIDPADATINTFLTAAYYFDEDHSGKQSISGMTNEEINAYYKSSKFSF
jgi:phage terminase large subunit-like protein